MEHCILSSNLTLCTSSTKNSPLSLNKEFVSKLGPDWNKLFAMICPTLRIFWRHCNLMGTQYIDNSSISQFSKSQFSKNQKSP